MYQGITAWKKDIMLGIMPGTKRQGRQKRQWIDNVTQWTGQGLVDIVRLAENSDMYRRFVYGVAYNARLAGTAHHYTVACGYNYTEPKDVAACRHIITPVNHTTFTILLSY